MWPILFLWPFLLKCLLFIVSQIFFPNLQVMIIRGKDKGETGLVKRVVRSQNRVLVEGKNLVSCSA